MIKVLAGGKTLNLPCATKMPGPIASSILTAHICMLVEIWQNKDRYNLTVIKAPTAVVDQVIQYHLEELKIQVDQDIYEDYLQEPTTDTPLSYDQVLNMYMRPVYAEQKGEVARLKGILK